MLYKKYHRNYIRQFKGRAFIEPTLISTLIKLNGKYEMVYSIKMKIVSGQKPLINWDGKLCYTRNITGTTLGNSRKELS